MTGLKMRCNGPPNMADRTDSHAMTIAGLNLIQQALSIYDSSLRLIVCNARFREMFDLPHEMAIPGAHFEDTIRHLVTRGEYGPYATGSKPHAPSSRTTWNAPVQMVALYQSKGRLCRKGDG